MCLAFLIVKDQRIQRKLFLHVIELTFPGSVNFSLNNHLIFCSVLHLSVAVIALNYCDTEELRAKNILSNRTKGFAS